MRTETVVKAVAAVLILVLPLGCGSSTSPAGTSAGSTGGSATGGGASSSSSSTGTGTGGGTAGAATTGGGIPGLGDACTYNVISGVDTCAKDGLECTSLISWVFCEGLDYPCPPTASSNGGPGTCALPEEIAPCSPQIGCQDAGAAPDGESDDFVCVSNGQGSACLYSCSQSSDCANITETCQVVGGQHVCTYDYCDENAQGDFVGPFWDACDAAGTGDGECLSWGGSPAAGAVCYQNGTVAAGQPCSTYRTNGGVDQSCVFGQFCVPIPADQTVGVCMELTDGTASHPCTDTTARALYDVIGANFGICAPACGDGGACPPNLACENIQGAGHYCVPN